MTMSAQREVSELALPLGSADRLIGVVDLGSHRQNFFLPELIAALTPLSRALAQAIDNARRHQRVQGQAKTLSVLYELVREVSLGSGQRGVAGAYCPQFP